MTFAVSFKSKQKNLVSSYLSHRQIHGQILDPGTLMGWILLLLSTLYPTGNPKILFEFLELYLVLLPKKTKHGTWKKCPLEKGRISIYKPSIFSSFHLCFAEVYCFERSTCCWIPLLTKTLVSYCMQSIIPPSDIGIISWAILRITMNQ